MASQEQLNAVLTDNCIVRTIVIDHPHLHKNLIWQSMPYAQDDNHFYKRRFLQVLLYSIYNMVD